MQVGPYTVVDEIARGGMGVVYRAQDPQGRPVALKLLHQLNPAARRRFQTEVDALARLRHPHVVSILAAGDHRGYPWLALEFVEGESLQDRLLKQGRLSIPEALRTGQQLAQALSYVHGCGVLHRDLKPANVLLGRGGAKLTDFGLALDDDSSLSRFTSSGVFQGTPGYWAPEQARGQRQRIGSRTDVYGLGAVLYACLTGGPPVQADSLQGYIAATEQGAVRPLRARRPEAPGWLEALCMRCLALDPDDRPGSAEEVARALVVGAASPTAGRPRRGALVLAFPLVGVGLLALGWAWSASRAAPPADRPVDDPDVEPAGDDTVDAGVDETEAALAALEEEVGRAVRERRFEDAAEALERGIAFAPERVDLRRDLAMTLGTLGREREALAQLGHARALDPGDPQTWAAEGTLLFNFKRYDQALAPLTRAIELEPGQASYRLYRADALVQLNRLDDALADYTRGVELNPDDYAGRYSRVVVLNRLGRFTDALRDLEHLLRLDPQQPDGWLARAMAYQALQRYEAAVADYDRALTLVPDRAPVWFERGLCRLALRRVDPALADFGRAIELAPDTTLYRYHRASTLSRLGRVEEALADYDHVLALDPGNAQAWFERGACHMSQGDPAQALRDFNRALETDPQLQQVFVNRGAAKMYLQDFAGAEADFRRALELDPRDAMGWVNLGVVLVQLDRLDEALAAYDRALALPGAAPRVRQRAQRLKGEALAKQGGK